MQQEQTAVGRETTVFGKRRNKTKNEGITRNAGTFGNGPEPFAEDLAGYGADTIPENPAGMEEEGMDDPYSSELLRDPWADSSHEETALTNTAPDYDLALEIDRRRQKKSRRRKRRRGFFIFLNLLVLGVVVIFLARKLTGLPGQLFPETGIEYGRWDYSVLEDEREDFKADIDGTRIPGHGNGQQYIAIHFLGVVGENHRLEEKGTGTHFYIYYDGTIYQAADLDAVTWQVGTNGYYTQLHPYACNSNTIGIELCVRCDGDPTDDHCGQWYFTEETQRAAVKLVRYLMREMNIPLDHVLRHGDIVDKWCPAPYMENNGYGGSWTWDEFLAAVRELPEEEIPDYPVVREP